MKLEKRIESISLLTEGLVDNARIYAEAVKKDGYANTGYNVERHCGKGAIQRRIALIREELLELSKSL